MHFLGEKVAYAVVISHPEYVIKQEEKSHLFIKINELELVGKKKHSPIG